MSIQTELTRITNAKASIVAAIEGKGVTVPDGTLLDGMAALIESIEAGGGGGNFATGTFTTTDDITSNIVLTHNLAVKPKYFFLYPINYNNNYILKILGMATQYGGKIEMICINPGKSSASLDSTSSDKNSENGKSGFWYRINYNETTFTIKQKNFSSTYGIGANTEFIWVAL